MVTGQRYQDSTDPSRTVVPTGRGDECRVYFDGCYAGKARVPASLFALTGWQQESIGFTAVVKQEQPSQAEAALVD